MQRNTNRKEPSVDTQDKTQNLIRFKLVQSPNKNNLKTKHNLLKNRVNKLKHYAKELIMKHKHNA